MLRILVISLVVANLLLLGFQSSKPPDQTQSRAAPAVVKDSGIPTIHLFNEMVEDQDLLSSNRQCFTLGPFHSSEDRDDVHKRLLELSTRISERRTEALVEKGYWVFMPPYASLLEANKKLLSLQALGLDDSVIIYEGEWKNAISLGYFLREENAQRRKQGLESKGFNPMLRIQRQAEPRYWLDYEQNPGSALIALDMQNRPNDFMQRPVPCPETDFFEAEVVASQDLGQDQAELQAPENTAEIGIETPVGQANGIDAEKAVETPGTQIPENIPDTSVKAPVEQAEANNTGKVVESATGQPAAAVEALPKKVVGTGPEHTVVTEPVQLEDSTTDGDVETPGAQETGNVPDDGAEKSTDGDSGSAPKKDADDASEPAPPAETEKGNGTGTETGKGR